MQRLFLFCGYPFSGKTTTAQLLQRELGYTVVCLDAINQELRLGIVGQQVTREQWEKTYVVFYKRLETALANGETVVADAVSHKKVRRDKLRELAQKYTVQATLCFFNTTEQQCRERMLLNRKTKERFAVSEKIFAQILEDFETPIAAEKPLIIAPGLSRQDLLRMFS